ncbi:hypothetical protein H5410_024006 [Solanum commersonii]|uniref:Serine hydrolase domain-containing protein n=1 Tax=Solanum commersonii TaxID=4109 RepID=A0A9J5ZKQ7_SOLCO|nr:hypothetical protein H5410_024006 [Solanum commersonii]
MVLELKQYDNFDKCLAYIQDCMIMHGPFDGLLGFSQGALISAALPGLQDKGVGLTKVPKIKYLIIIGGAKLQIKPLAEKAYSSAITCPFHSLLSIFCYVARTLQICVSDTGAAIRALAT